MAGYKTYPTFDEFFSDQSESKQNIISGLRKFVKQVSPDLIEGSKWGNGVWLNHDLPVAFAHVEKDHVQFGFFGGALLNDSDNLLEGRARYVRHVKIRSQEDIDRKALKPLVKQAATLNYKKQ